MNISDQYIVEGINIGDKSVFDQVFKTYYAGLCTYAYDFVRSSEFAEEIVQNFFLHIWENHSKLVITTSLKSYLYRSIHNRSLNYIRDHRHSLIIRIPHDEFSNYTELLSTDLPDAIFDTAFSEEAERKLGQAIDDLPEQCRIIFCMCRYERLSYQEITGRLNVSLSTVKTQMSRAMKKLTEKMDSYLGVK